MPSKEARLRMLKKNGIPEGLTQEFVDATYVVMRATDFAISKALRNEKSLINKFTKGDTTEGENKVRLSHEDVENIEKSALSYMPTCIRQCSQGEAEPIRVNELATKIFEGYGDDLQIEKISKRLPKVLGSACEMPEPEGHHVQ